MQQLLPRIREPREGKVTGAITGTTPLGTGTNFPHAAVAALQSFTRSFAFIDDSARRPGGTALG